MSLRSGPRGARSDPRGPKTAPRAARSGPRAPQEPPKRLPKDLQDALQVGRNLGQRHEFLGHAAPQLLEGLGARRVTVIQCSQGMF